MVPVKGELEKFLESAKEKLSKVTEETIKLAKRGEEEVVRASKIGKLKLDLIGLNNRVERRFRDLGSQIYKLSKKRGIDLPEVKDLLTQLGDLETQMKEKERAIKKLSREKAKRG